MRRECDLEELKTFQQRNLEVYRDMLLVSKHMVSCAEEASGLLRDDVSRKNLERIRYIAQELQNIAQHGGDHMDNFLCKTKNELAIWDELR